MRLLTVSTILITLNIFTIAPPAEAGFSALCKNMYVGMVNSNTRDYFRSNKLDSSFFNKLGTIEYGSRSKAINRLVDLGLSHRDAEKTMDSFPNGLGLYQLNAQRAANHYLMQLIDTHQTFLFLFDGNVFYSVILRGEARQLQSFLK